MTWALTEFASEEQWLAARRGYVTSSDIPIILGVSPWGNAWDLWIQKTGGPGLRADHEQRMRRRFEAGRHFEPLIGRWFAEETGREPLRPAEGYYLATNQAMEWAAVTPDFLVIDGRGPDGAVEGKSASTMDLAGYEESPAFHYATSQLHLTLDVLEMGGGWIATTFGLGNSFRVYPVEKSAELAALIRERGAAFHELVMTKTPPGEDFLRSGEEIGRALARIFSAESGELVEIEARFAEMAVELEEARKRKKDAEEEIERLTNAFKLRLGAATFGRIPGYPKLAKWATEKAQEYTVKKEATRVLRFVRDGRGMP